MDLGYRCSLLYKAFWGEEEKEQIRVKIERKNELRRYMGSKAARVPRGAIVRLIAVINGKRGVFEYDGERFIVPIRILHKIKAEEEFKRADELLIERFEDWLERHNYSEAFIKTKLQCLRRLFREIGFPTIEKMDEKYGLLLNTTKRHLYNTFYRFCDFLRSSLTEEVKKGKEGIECELSR